MSVRSKLDLVRRMPRVGLYNVKDNRQFNPHADFHWRKRKFGHKGAEARQSLLPIGFHIRKTPFYLAIPSEPYNADWATRREMARISLFDLQRLVDLGRLDASKPIDLSSICNTKLFRLEDRQYGFQLTDDGCDCFEATLDLEVQHASEAAIAAVERNGGRVVVRFYDLASVATKADPAKHFRSGLPIPACKLPPRDAVEYYSQPANRGYLADQDECRRLRYELAQKYGYELRPFEGDGEIKSPRQIFNGLQPGSVVDLTDAVVYRPNSEEVRDYYERPV